MKKEIKRFTNKLLYDPISRVARDPLRKLAHDNRLVKAIQVALFNKSLPKNCAIGIKAALKYFNKNDEQSKHLKVMIENFGEKYVLNKICGLKNNEALVNFCLLQKII
jgi:mannitol-1-phosphate 5-dehydrogenase